MGFFKKNYSTSNKVFDWDAYYNDISRGISTREQKKKFKRLEYYVSENTISSRKNSYA